MYFYSVKKNVVMMLIVVLIIGIFACTVFSQEKAEYRLRLSTSDPISDSKFKMGIEYFKERAEQLTDGRLTVEIHGGAVLGTGREGYENVRMGTLEALLEAIGPMTVYVPEYGILDLPYFLTDVEKAELVLDGIVGSKLKELSLEKGFRVLGFWHDAYRNLYGNAAVRSIEDMKGVKIRTMDAPIIMSMYKAFGGTPVPMSFSEIYTSLQTGVIDAVDCTVTSGWSNKHNEVSKYFTKLDYVYCWNLLTVSEKWWQSLPEDIQQAIFQAELEARRWANKEGTAKHAKQSFENWEKSGVEIITLDLEPFKKASEAVHIEWKKNATKENLEFYEMVEKYR